MIEILPYRWLTAPRVYPVRLSWILFLFLIVATGCGRFQGAENAKAQPPAEPQPIDVVVAEVRNWPRTIRVQGSLWGDEDAVVGTMVQGLVRTVDVEMGTVVKQGDTLAILDPEEFELRVQQAESQWRQARASLGLKPDASEENLDPEQSPAVRQEKAMLNDAKSKLERARTLYKQRAVAIEELQQLEAAEDAAKARYDSSLNAVDEKLAVLGVRRSELAMARREKKESTIVAPFDGIVRERHVAPGVYVQVGDPVVSLVRTDPLRYRAGVPEIDAVRIQLGQKVRIMPEGQKEVIEAVISRMSPSVDPASRALAIEVDVPNPDSKLQAGLFAEAQIVVNPQAETLAVPESAVREFAGVEKVWAIEDGKAVEKPIRSGRREDGYIEVLDGLEPGTLVAADAMSTKTGPVVVRTTDAAHAVQHSE